MRQVGELDQLQVEAARRGELGQRMCQLAVDGIAPETSDENGDTGHDGTPRLPLDTEMMWAAVWGSQEGTCGKPSRHRRVLACGMRSLAIATIAALIAVA